MMHRWYKHKSSARRGSASAFHSAIRKYGEYAWDSCVIHDNISSAKEAELLEKYYISLYDTYVNGYNATTGGHYMPVHDQAYKIRTVGSFIHMPTGVEEHNISVLALSKKYGIRAKHLYSVVSGRMLGYLGWRLLANKERVRIISEATRKLRSTARLGVQLSSRTRQAISVARLKNAEQYTFYNVETGTVEEQVTVVYMMNKYSLGRELYSLSKNPLTKEGYNKSVRGWCLVVTSIEDVKLKPVIRSCYLRKSDGILEKNITAAEMAAKYGLNANKLMEVRNGTVKSHKGWVNGQS